MRTARILVCWTLLTVLTPSPIPAADLEEHDPAYYHTGELAGSLRSNDPLPLFDADPQHLWNRLFAAVTIRPSLLPSVRGGPPVARIEGGDRIEFFGWGGTTYWDDPANVAAARTTAGSVPRRGRRWGGSRPIGFDRRFDVKRLRSSLRRQPGNPTDPPSTRTDSIAPVCSSTPAGSAPPPHHPPSTSSPSHKAAA